MEFLNRPSRILVAEDALSELPDRERRLVEEYYLPILEAGQPFYEAQKKYGFYPPDLSSHEALSGDGLSPYTLVRRVEDGRLRVLRYTDSDPETKPFRSSLKCVAAKIDQAIDYARSSDFPQSYLIRDVLAPQAEALRRGDFEGAMITRLNAYSTPDIEVGFWLLDRYLDRLHGAKFAGQGWIITRDRVLTDAYNGVTNLIAEGSNHPHRVVAGDVIAYGGLAADRKWSANTLPSEDHLRTQFGSVGFIFRNRISDRVEADIKPGIRTYVPQITSIPNWERMTQRAAELAIVLHENGHSKILFETETVKILGGFYTPFKEMLSDAYGRVDGGKLPNSYASTAMRQLILTVLLSLGRIDIDDYHKETDPHKKQILYAYAQAAEWMFNFQERNEGLKVNSDNGVITVTDWDTLIKNDANLLGAAYDAIRGEGYLKGSVSRFARLNSRFPRRYLEDTSRSTSNGLVHHSSQHISNFQSA